MEVYNMVAAQQVLNTPEHNVWAFEKGFGRYTIPLLAEVACTCVSRHSNFHEDISFVHFAPVKTVES